MTHRATYAGISRRLARIFGLCLLTGGRMTVILITARRSRRAVRLTAELVCLIEQLGGAFIKAGQIMATRVDLVGPAAAAELNRLHDCVTPMAAADATSAVRRALGSLPCGMVDALTRPPVASGSVASVYRVPLDDRTVALKVRRPGIGKTIAADLAIIAGLARVITRLPAFRRVPVVEITDQIGRCLIGQLDFAREAEQLRSMREHLAAMPGVYVPTVVPELCGEGVLGMEFVDGLAHASIEELPVQVREAEVAVLVRAVYHLLFAAGFVHVDLHQGNSYFRPDGTVVLLDAGFAYTLSREAAQSFTAFFGGMINGEGTACADILYATVRGPGPSNADDEFHRGVAELVERNTGSRVHEFNLSQFCVELFDLQRRAGLFAEPEFIFPMLCLLSLEGLVKDHHPTMDFQIEAAPYVMHNLLSEPLDERPQIAL